MSNARNLANLLGTNTKVKDVDVDGTELVLDSDGDTSITSDTDDQIDFKTGGSDRVTIGSNGNIGINSTSTDHQLTINASAFEGIQFQKDGSDCGYIVVNTNKMFFGGGDNIDFHTGSGTIINGTTRMRIDSNGAMILGRTDAFTSGGGNTGGNGGLHIARDNERCLFLLRSGGNGEVVNFIRGGITNPVGTISIDTSSTAYNTSSDYRLKENIVTDWDATSRLKQLKPSRFNFKVEKDTTVDGFLAHEVSGIVPEAITGEKDAVDKEGNPEYQGIDQSKLVPLLTKALQEAVAKIETLEAKVTALESK